MKKIGFGILTGFLLMFTGCLDNEDGYSLNDVWIGFGTVQKAADETVTVKLDNNDVLVPVVSNYPYWELEKFENGKRIIVNYTVLDEDENSSLPRYFVKINSVKDVLTKGILDITTENQDSIGNDPIVVQECWMTDSLLNFQLKYWGRYKVHFINLVKQPGTLTADSQPFELELRHNDNDDDEAILFTAFVSFKLKNLQVAGLDSVSFRVTSSDYEGEEFEYEGVYKYGGDN